MPTEKTHTLKQVQTFGKKKTAIAVATVTKAAQCNIRVNGVPVSQILPETLREKILEAVKVVGSRHLSRLRIDVTVRGSGQVAQAYATRQAIAKGLVAYYQKYKNEVEKAALKDKYLAYDKFLLIADPRRCEPKKWGRHSARTRFTKSYRTSMPAEKTHTLKQVQTFGKKKTAIAVATVTKAAQCNIRVNGVPVSQILPETLREKILEAVKVVGSRHLSRLRIDVTVRGSGQVAQAYATRQAIAKGLVAYYQKYKNEVEKAALKDKYLAYDKFLLIADPRRCEPKKWGRHSARTRFTKSYR